MNWDNIITIDMGDMVVCDICNKDYTNRTDSGGVYFSGKAICPKCTPRFIDLATKHDELHLMTAWCPKELSFAEWVRKELR
jgi:hydrogenase maturation factor HypF (carbamoyltransferase family)